jgi:hypothetical protein
MSLTSNISGDTLAVHLSDLSSKQVFTKTGYYKVRVDCAPSIFVRVLMSPSCLQSTLVAIKKIGAKSIGINKPQLMQFKKVGALSIYAIQGNLLPFCPTQHSAHYGARAVVFFTPIGAHAHLSA